MKVGVLALQGAVTAHTAALARCGVEAVAVRDAAGLDAVDALVLPGGESTTISMLAERFGLWEPLRSRLAEGMPAFGTCAGMILLADEVLDGRADQGSLGVIDIAVRRNAFGRQVESFEAGLDVEGLASPFHAVFIRAPVVERAGPGVAVLSTYGGRPVLCRQGRVLVSAFHPELAGDDRLHRLFVGLAEQAPG